MLTEEEKQDARAGDFECIGWPLREDFSVLASGAGKFTHKKAPLAIRDDTEAVVDALMQKP